MMQKKSQKKLKLTCSKNIIDIVQFGSSVVEESNPNDIDVAIIYKEVSLKEQLEESQKIKKQLSEIFEIPIHVKSYDLYSLFSKGNFAGNSILFYGKSLITKDYFSKYFKLIPRIQIKYVLSDLEKKDKIRFNYLLNGKKGQYGLLRKYAGRLISPGIIEIFPEYEKIFIEKIKKITSKFEIKKIFYSLE